MTCITQKVKESKVHLTFFDRMPLKALLGNSYRPDVLNPPLLWDYLISQSGSQDNGLS